MTKELLNISFHNPLIWLALLYAAVLVLANVTKAIEESKRKTAMEKFATAGGFTFSWAGDPGLLNITGADFFWNGDQVLNVVGGSLEQTPFILFDQKAQRGKRSFVRTVAAFHVDPTVPFRPAKVFNYDLEMEKSAANIFIWQAKKKIPAEELLAFLQSGYTRVQLATS
jgi:hypothetical protein